MICPVAATRSLLSLSGRHPSPLAHQCGVCLQLSQAPFTAWPNRPAHTSGADRTSNTRDLLEFGVQILLQIQYTPRGASSGDRIQPEATNKQMIHTMLDGSPPTIPASIKSRDVVMLWSLEHWTMSRWRRRASLCPCLSCLKGIAPGISRPWWRLP